MKRLCTFATFALLVAGQFVASPPFGAVRAVAQGSGAAEFYLLRAPHDVSLKAVGTFVPEAFVDSRFGPERPEYTNIPYSFINNPEGKIRNVQSVCVQELGKSLGCLVYKKGISLAEHVGLRQSIRVPMAPGEHSFKVVLRVPGEEPVDVDPVTLSVIENRATMVRLQFKDAGTKALGGAAKAVNNALCGGLLWKCRGPYGAFSVATSYQIEPALPLQPRIADVTALSEMLSADDWTVRWNALNAIGQIDDERVLEPMSHALDDQRVEVVMLAASLLSKIQRQAQSPAISERVFQFLATSLQSKEWGIRAGAIEILGDFGDARGVTLLSTFKNSDASLQGLDPAPDRGAAKRAISGTLRKAAEGAINKLNGKRDAR